MRLFSYENCRSAGIPAAVPERGPQSHWISVELRGTTSNGLALNTRVKAVAGIFQTGEVFRGGSYLSRNDLQIHFGLGNDDRVERLEILWPAGETVTIASLTADRFYCIEEGNGVVAREAILPSTPLRSHS